MQLDIKRNKRMPFGELRPGQVFAGKDGEVFLRIVTLEEAINAISLKDGSHHLFDNWDEIEAVNVKIVEI